MNKGILRKILITNLILIMFLAVLTPVIYAAGLVQDDDQPGQKPSQTTTTPTYTPSVPTYTPSAPSYTPSGPSQSYSAMTASISGNVWEDLNLSPNEDGILVGNGKFEDGIDKNISNIKVSLYKVNNGENINNVNLTSIGEKVAETTTNEYGYYEFTDLKSGQYRVEFIYGAGENDYYNAQTYKSVKSKVVVPTATLKPVDIVILVDSSNSMKNLINGIKSALKQSVTNILADDTLKEYIRISIWSFSINPKMEVEFTNDLKSLYSAVDQIQPRTFTNTPAGILAAEEYLNTESKPNAEKMFLIFTDGVPEPPNIGMQVTDSEGNNTINSLLNGTYHATVWNELQDGGEEEKITYPIKTNYNRLKSPGVDWGCGTDMSFDDGKRVMANFTQHIWEHMEEDIHKYAICYYDQMDDLISFTRIFGESSNIEKTADINQLTNMITKDYPTNMSKDLNKVQRENAEKYTYVNDSEYMRLDNMVNLMQIENETLSKANHDKVYLMKASTGVLTVFGGTQLSNVNLALEKRPEQHVLLDKKVDKLDVLLSDNSTLINWDSNYNNGSIKNLQVIPNHSFLAIMDDELTHGATIRVKYSITLANLSERDNLANYFTDDFLERVLNNTDNQFSSESQNIWRQLAKNNAPDDYYSIAHRIIPTSYFVMDYFGNNLFFDNYNSDTSWVQATTNTVSSQLASEFVETKIFNMSPNSFSTPRNICGSKLLAISDTSDLNTFENYAEISRYSNVLGKVITDTDSKIITPGNLNINNYEGTHEVDDDKAETISRVPPFGADLSQTILLIGIAIIIIEIIILTVLKVRIKGLRSKYIRR